MTPILDRERLIFTLACLLDGVRHVAVGASSPIPAAAAMLLRARKQAAGAKLPAISVLGSSKHNFYTNGSVELFDAAAQGRIDAFFLGGGQIDGRGNVNLVGTGEYPQLNVRWPGSFGSSFLYFVVPRVILFREEHTPRVFVDQVDFTSAPGSSDRHIYRRGGPYALLTGKALFSFDREKQAFRLRSVHPGETLQSVLGSTGFSFEHDGVPTETPHPPAEVIGLLRGRVLGELEETYPEFAIQMREGLRQLGHAG